MTLNDLINLLKKSGVNSKGQVIDLLTGCNAYELEELAQSLQQRVNEITKEKTKGGNYES